MLENSTSFQKLIAVVLLIIGFTFLSVDVIIISYLIEKLGI